MLKIMLIIVAIILMPLGFLVMPIKISYIYDSDKEKKSKIVIKIMFLRFNIDKFINCKNKKSKKIKKTKKDNRVITKKIEKNKNKEDKPPQNQIKTKNNNLSNIFKDKSLTEYLEIIENIYNLSSVGIKNLFYHIKFENLSFYQIISGSDAAQIGLNYVKFNIVAYNIFNILNRLFFIKNPSIYIYPDFVNNNNKNLTHIAFDTKFRLITILSILLIFSIKLIKYIKNYNFNNRKV